MRKLLFKTKLFRCSPREPGFEDQLEREFELYRSYQAAVHNDNPNDVKKSSFLKFLADTTLVDVSPNELPCSCENMNSCGCLPDVFLRLPCYFTD